MKQDKLFRVCVISAFILLGLAYCRHFNSDFHFDDSHCITNNAYVRDLRNIPLFFKTATTFSSLPLNQTYRPMLTTMFAIAYKMGGGSTVPFHIFIFLFYLLQGILMYLLVIKIFDVSFPNELNKYFALFTTAWYMLNTANAETISYISASSDSISTFWVIAGLVAYIYLPVWRKYFLYLIPVIIGVLFKQSALVFPGLLAAYVFLFEKQSEGFLQRAKHTLLVILPGLIISAALYKLQAKLTSQTYITGGNPFNYIITQPFVMLHYFVTFFFPVGLSADNDWVAFESMSDYRFWVGLMFLVVLAFTMWVLYKKPKYFPIVFGLEWFFVALLPATLVPLSEVMNDHRTFFPYVGLAIAAGWSVRLFYEQLKIKNYKLLKPLTAAMVAILIVNAAGAYVRNNVWHTDEALWYDVTLKSPNNGRGLMNYGLTQMSTGNYKVAEDYFQRALKLLPSYSYLYENIGILKAAEKQNAEAEKYFKQAISFGSGIPVIYYYYAKFLHDQNRSDEAVPLLKQAIELSPGEIYSHYLLMQIYQEQENWQALAEEAKQTLTILPGDEATEGFLKISAGKKSKLEVALDNVKQHPTPDNYINLSLVYYNQKEYDKCIDACNEALKLDPKNYLAYNNIGSAYNMTGDWDKAMQAFKEALKLKPDFDLAKNNYNYAHSQASAIDSLNNLIKKAPTPELYINLSLVYYNQKQFLKSAEACKEAIKLNPANAIPYNNMCAAYNNLAMWDDAIAAGEKAVQLDPNNQLAKNNLLTAKQGKAKSEQK
jgi:tetratricopeptide (TPR) repeat protein